MPTYSQSFVFSRTPSTISWAVISGPDANRLRSSIPFRTTFTCEPPTSIASTAGALGSYGYLRGFSSFMAWILPRPRPRGRAHSPSRSSRPESTGRRRGAGASASTLSSPVTSQRIWRARFSAGYVSVMRRRPWYGPVSATSRSDDVEHRVAGHERGRVAVGAEPEMDEVELPREGVRVVGRRGVEVVGPTGIARTSAAPPAGGALELREVAVGIVVGRDALVDLEDRHLLPGHAPVELGEHRPGRAAARHGEREAAAVRRPLPLRPPRRSPRRARRPPRRRGGSRSRAPRPTPSSRRGRRTACASRTGDGSRSRPCCARRTASTAPS